MHSNRLLRGKIVFKNIINLKKDTKIYLKIVLDSGRIVRQIVVPFIPREMFEGDHVPFEISNFELHTNSNYFLDVLIQDKAYRFKSTKPKIVDTDYYTVNVGLC